MTHLSDLDLPSRALNSLSKAGFVTTEQVRAVPIASGLAPAMEPLPTSRNLPDYLCDIRLLGFVSLLCVLDALAAVGEPHPQDADARRWLAQRTVFRGSVAATGDVVKASGVTQP